ncbi:ATP-binding protein [Streptomyces xinghaiensis]|uniref:ATP-binding protein n=1 Tax=Streptomyces xinghaiensis TaxID=1038928 RepID=UPI000680238E|nr:ATP-binding protein [Streptomyces xinghaiensis]MZE76082.1 ATP-binding protein [Streptomyces sp. SID5475]
MAAMRNELVFRLSRRRSSVPRARALLHALLGDWGVGEEAADTAELVLSELVTNALCVRAPKDRQVGVRIVRAEADGLLRLEVSDAGTGTPEIRSPAADETGGRGLLLVETLSHRWGVRRREGGIGKTVWAEVKAPGLAPRPGAGTEVAAVAVRAGRQVRVRGAWRTVRDVRAEPCASGGLVVTFALDTGPALCLSAAEPLTVRDGADAASPTD